MIASSISLVATGLALVSYGVPVAIEYGVESMSNGEDRAVSELCAYCRLDQLVCLHVHGSRRLVQHQDGSLAQQSSRQTDQLTLTHATTRMHAHTQSGASPRPAPGWRRPPGRPRTTWMKNIHDDLSSLDLGIHEARDLAQNRPLCRLLSACTALRTRSGACYCWTELDCSGAQ